MLEFSELDFILFCLIFYLCGIGTGLSICCYNKETFLQRVKSREDLSSYNHHNHMPEPATILAQPHATQISIK